MNTERLATRIKAHEGLRLKPYTDSLGRLTIGYGRCLETRGISRAEAEALFRADLAAAIAAAEAVAGAASWAALGRVRREVLVEMVYQLGAGGASRFARMLAALRAGDYGRAADEMLDSRWHGQTPARCEALAALMRGGDADAG